MERDGESDPVTPADWSESATRSTDVDLDRRSVLRKGVGVVTIGFGGTDRVGSTGGATLQRGEGEPNDTKARATYVEPGRVNGHVGPCCVPGVSDEDDWFVFDVRGGDGILVDFRERPPARARLIGPDDSVLDVEGTSPRRLAGTAARSGRAYVHVTGPPGSANGDYSFTLSLDRTGGDDDGGGGGGGAAPGTIMLTANVPVEYTLAVDGTLKPDTEGGQFSGEESDAPTEERDGVWTVRDSTGPHPTKTDGKTFYGDRFFVSGSITDLEVNPGSSAYDVNLYLDERQVTAGEAREFTEPGETHTFMLTANGPTQYALSVDGTLEPDTKGGQFSGEDDDTPARNGDGVWTVSDSTGPHPTNADGSTYYGDRFLFTGTVVGLDLSTPEGSGDVNLYLDEAQVSRGELVGTST